MDVGEAPVGEGSDDGGDKLGKCEGGHESERGALHEEESVRTGNEDQRLGDDSNLQVDDHVQLPIVVVVSRGSGTVLKHRAELVVEEGCPDDDRNKSDTGRPKSAR